MAPTPENPPSWRNCARPREIYNDYIAFRFFFWGAPLLAQTRSLAFSFVLPLCKVVLHSK